MSNGTVEIHGKVYETVALRVRKFRDKHPAYTLRTDIKKLDEEMVVVEAQILDESGRMIANGHAQEFRQSSQINRTSYVENCETSAIGRALACFGLGGTEFATADEVAHAITSKKGPDRAHGHIPAADAKPEAWARLAKVEGEHKYLMKLAADIQALLTEDRADDAYGFLRTNYTKLDEDEQLGIQHALDQLLNKEQHKALKEAGERFRMTQKAAERQERKAA